MSDRRPSPLADLNRAALPELHEACPGLHTVSAMGALYLLLLLKERGGLPWATVDMERNICAPRGILRKERNGLISLLKAGFIEILDARVRTSPHQGRYSDQITITAKGEALLARGMALARAGHSAPSTSTSPKATATQA